MPSHYKGTEEELRALNMFIALARGSESFFGRLFDQLGPCKITPSQFGVLETLYHLGPMTSSQIAEKHLRSRNNLSVVIANLEREGLVLRKTCPGDRRAHFVELSDEGKATIEMLFPRFVSVLVKQTNILTPQEQESLGKLLKKLGKAETV